LKYRGRTAIVATILEAARDGSTKTRIMYKSYLSHDQLKEYLSVLVKNGLLEYRPAEHEYKTTEKGMKFQRLYQQLDELIGSSLGEST
jgi:predicted transcriptional regulator